MSAMEGIAAVAERIRDRANQLASERAVLELVQAEQEQQQLLLDQELEQCGQVRREYLSAIRSRHGIELELWKLQSQRTKCLETMETIQEETQEILEYKQELQEQWEELVREVLSPHTLHQAMYRHSLQGSMKQLEQLQEKRQKQLSALEQHANTFCQDQVRMQDETKRLQDEAQQMAELEQQEEDEIATLNSQVQEAIAKRSHLRKSVRASKRVYDESTDEMLRLEKEYSELAGYMSNGGL